MTDSRSPVFLVIGAGAGIGGNAAMRFAAGGYHAVLARRSDEEGLARMTRPSVLVTGGATRIGKAIAWRCHYGFGMEVRFYNRSPVAHPGLLADQVEGRAHAMLRQQVQQDRRVFRVRAIVEGELACEAEFMAMFDVPKA